MAQPHPPKGARVVVPSRQKAAAGPGKAEIANGLGFVAKDTARPSFAPEPDRFAMAETPASETRDRRATEKAEAVHGATTVATRAEAPDAGVTMSQAEFKEEVTVTGIPATSASARAADAVNRPRPAQAIAGIAQEANPVTIVVIDEGGRPCGGVTVALERVGQGVAGTRTAWTDGSGTATFRGVPPGTYRAVATGASITPAQGVFTVASERKPTRAELRVRALLHHE
jgi:hypothetical protein